MCFYTIKFKNGNILSATNIEIENDTVWIYDYMRKGKQYDLIEVLEIIETINGVRGKIAKVVFENKHSKCLVLNFKKSPAEIEKELKKSIYKNKVEKFDFLDTLTKDNYYVLRLFKANYKQCAKWIVKEYYSQIDIDNKTIKLFV